MDYKKLAGLLFPDAKDISYYLEKYPKREKKDGEEILRFAPSPTGFIHMGSLFAAFVPEIFSHQSNGKFILRIEDTDQKREIDNGIENIIRDLKNYKFIIDESPMNEGKYGPYIQTKRKEIYLSFAKYLVSIGKAYPCFCSEESIQKMRETQQEKKDRIGYYGKYAKCRNLTYEEIEAKIKNGDKFVIRLKSEGDFNKKFIFNDLIKGKMEFPENDIDHVLLKSDGLPPYAFAHVVDDYLMDITTITRADEYVSSIPYHLQIWEAFGFPAPQYAHIAPLTKREGTTIRKLSKRKDPEAAVSYYSEMGIPVDAVRLYLATLLNSDFEMWYMQNPEKTISDFTFKFNKMSVGGSLFDLDKLINISKIYFSKKSSNDIYEETLEYSKDYDRDFYNILLNNKEKVIAFLNIERNIPRPRKDISCYSDVKKETSYIFDELFNEYETPKKEFYDSEILKEYFANYYNDKDDKDTWFNKIKDLCPKFGFASETKDYKQNPEKYKGSVADVCEIIRVAITGRTMTPDLYEILKLFTKEQINERIKLFDEYLQK